jgi:hypothetical protein
MSAFLSAGIASRKHHRELPGVFMTDWLAADWPGRLGDAVVRFCHLSTNYQAGLRFSEGESLILSVARGLPRGPGAPQVFGSRSYR